MMERIEVLITDDHPMMREALKATRSQLPGVVILALVPNEVPGQEGAALAAGADAVLSKNASRDSLLDALRELWITALLKRGEETTDVRADENLDEEVRRGSI
jgi:DNA-binding NarL/FixJ family response regulator